MELRRLSTGIGSVMMSAGVVICAVVLVVAPPSHFLGHHDHGAGPGRVPRVSKLSSEHPRTIAEVGALTGFACDMHCEPGRLYEAAGVCPVCRMALTDVDALPWGVRVKGGGKSGVLTAIDPTGLEFEERGSVEMRPEWVLPLQGGAMRRVSSEGDVEKALVGETGGFWVLGTIRAPGGRADRFAAKHAPSDEAARASTAAWRENFDEPIAAADGAEVRVRCSGALYEAGPVSLFRIGMERDGADVAMAAAPPSLIFVSQDLLTVLEAAPVSDADAPARRKHNELGNGRESDAVYEVTFPTPGLYRGFLRGGDREPALSSSFVVEAHTAGGVSAPASPLPVDGKHHHKQ